MIKKTFVQVNVFEDILETKDIEIKEELLDNDVVAAAAEYDPLAIVLTRTILKKYITFLLPQKNHSLFVLLLL
jgi:hypothetical protein